MRHHNQNRTFGRSSDQRKALLRGLALSLIAHGKIKTTDAKARELRSYVEKIITKGKTDTLSARKHVMSTLGQPSAKIIAKIFTEISPRYADRKGGYTRIIKMGETKAGRREAMIELV